MRYFFGKVLKNLFFNRKSYLLIGIETILSIMILGIGFHVLLSYNDELKKLGKISSSTLHRIQTVVEENADTLPITIEDYEFCKNNYNQNGKAAFIYSIGEPVSYYDEEINVENFWYLFVSEEFYKYYLETEQYKIDAIYVGSTLRQWMQKDNITLLSGYRSLDYFKGKELRDIKELNSPLTSYFPYPGSALGSEYFFENLAILPLKEYDNALGATTSVDFMIKTDLEYLESTSYSVIQYLSTQHPENEKRNAIMVAGDSQYGLSSETEKFISQNKLAINKYELASTYTGMALIIIIFGLGGILMLLVQRQKKTYAISIMLGASNVKLVLELFAEVLLVMWTSTGIGLLLGALFLKAEETRAFQISFHFIVIWCCFSITLIITILACIIPAVMMRRLSPTEILRQAE